MNNEETATVIEKLTNAFVLFQIYNDKGELFPLLDTELGKELFEDTLKIIVEQHNKKNTIVKENFQEVMKKAPSIMEMPAQFLGYLEENYDLIKKQTQ